jgi:hypothetical protein
MRSLILLQIYYGGGRIRQPLRRAHHPDYDQTPLRPLGQPVRHAALPFRVS